MLTPCCPRAGPTGGAGVAFPAGICSLMYMSGGSDFHGTGKKNHNLGIGHGNLNIDYEIIESWANNYIKNIKKYKK